MERVRARFVFSQNVDFFFLISLILPLIFHHVTDNSEIVHKTAINGERWTTYRHKEKKYKYPLIKDGDIIQEKYTLF